MLHQKRDRRIKSLYWIYAKGVSRLPNKGRLFIHICFFFQTETITWLAFHLDFLCTFQTRLTRTTEFCVSTTPNIPETPFQKQPPYHVPTVANTLSITTKESVEEITLLVTIDMHGRIYVKWKFMVSLYASKLSFWFLVYVSISTIQTKQSSKRLECRPASL